MCVYLHTHIHIRTHYINTDVQNGADSDRVEILGLETYITYTHTYIHTYIHYIHTHTYYIHTDVQNGANSDRVEILGLEIYITYTHTYIHTYIQYIHTHTLHTYRCPKWSRLRQSRDIGSRWKFYVNHKASSKACESSE
jgi:hypothetical protein